MSNETQQTNIPPLAERQKQGLVIHPPGWRQADDAQEQWNRVHAQLLKSVADAQARLLAGINEVSDRVEVLSGRLTALTVSAAALNGNHSGLKGQLDAIGAILAELLAKPRRRILDPSIARAKRLKR